MSIHAVIGKNSARIWVSSGHRRKTYAVGATRKRGNTTYVKQWRMSYDRNGKAIGYLCSRGRSLTEWVVQGSRRDRESPNFKP